MLKIIGTSHIAKQSIEDVKLAIEEKPDIIAIELDRKRYFAIQSPQKSKLSISQIVRIGIKGYVFSLIGAWAEKKLGEIVKVEPGSEMKMAIKLAKKEKIPIALIDQDIEITLKKLSKSISWKEKWNFLVDIIKGVIFRKSEIEFDLTKVPEKDVIYKMISKVKKRYPNIYKVLVTERNKIMALNLRKIIQDNPDKKVLAIVGAGHESEILKIINKDNSITYTITV